MNQIGTMTSNVTMYASLYNWEKALFLFICFHHNAIFPAMPKSKVAVTIPKA